MVEKICIYFWNFLPVAASLPRLSRQHKCYFFVTGDSVCQRERPKGHQAHQAVLEWKQNSCRFSHWTAFFEPVFRVQISCCFRTHKLCKIFLNNGAALSSCKFLAFFDLLIVWSQSMCDTYVYSINCIWKFIFLMSPRQPNFDVSRYFCKNCSGHTWKKNTVQFRKRYFKYCVLRTLHLCRYVPVFMWVVAKKHIKQARFLSTEFIIHW